MNASDLNTRRDDEDDNDDDTNVERDSPKNDSPKNDRDCDAQRDPSLAENVGVLTYFHVPQLETTTFRTRLRYWVATFQSLSPLFRSLLPLVRCCLTWTWQERWFTFFNSASSSSAASGPSPSKLDKATACMLFLATGPEWIIYWFHRFLAARAALCNRFAELGVLKSGETAPLCMLFGFIQMVHWLIYVRSLVISNIWGPRRANSSASNLDGSHSGVATNSTLNSSNSNEKEVNLKESNVPLNSLGNITRPLTCPGCWMDFKTFSGFVLHIENHSCMSSTCHEIEDQLDACVARIFSTLQVGRAWTSMNPESSRLGCVKVRFSS